MLFHRETLHSKRLLILTSMLFFCFSYPSYAVVSTQAKPAKHAPKKNIRVLTFKDKKKAQEIRAKAIRSIKEILDTEKDPGKRYELLRRYGEQYAEQAEYALEKEMLIYDEQYQKWEKRKKGEAPKLEQKNSQLSLKKAVSIYKEIVAKYSNNKDIDVTLYELGKNMLRLNDKAGVTYLLRLIKDHKNSSYIPEALFALGEHYFDDEHNMVEARKYYNEAAKHREHSIYPYAVYKLGWTYYNYPATSPEEETEKFKKAVTAFKLVVKLASNVKDEEDRVMYLRQEAINDLIMVWAETEDVDSAWDYFKQIDEQVAFYKMLEKLGAIYVDQGKNEKAALVYLRILKEVPSRESNPENHAKLIDIYAVDSKFGEVVKHAKLMTKFYLTDGKWRKANAQKPDLIKEAETTVEMTLHRHSTAFHKDAQKRKHPDLYKTAASLYEIYLESFPSNPKAYELRFFLADVLFELKRYDDAATQYLMVVRSNEKDGKYLHDSSMNAVIAMNKVVSETKFPPTPPLGKADKAIAIPKPKKKLQDSLDSYARLFPKKDDTKAMRVTAAKISFEYGHYDDAINRYKDVVLAYPNTKQGEEGLRAVLSYFKDRKDWDTTIKYTKLFLNTKNVLTGPLRQETHTLLVFASFERALQFERDNKPLEAATAFIQFQSDFPKEKDASSALYNAMVIYFKNGLVTEALETAKTVLTAYPEYVKKADVIMTMAETYEGLGDFANAAKYYASFSKQWPKEKRAPDSLYTAGILSKGAGHDVDVIANLTLFLKYYPNHKNELAAYQELAEAYERAGQMENAVTIYETIANKYKNMGDDLAKALVKIVQLKNGSTPDMKEVWKLQKWLSTRGSPDAVEARRLLAAMIFNYANQPFKAFLDSKIDNSKLEESLQKKQGELVSLARLYQATIALQNGEYSVAATYRLGQAHEAFATLIAKTMPPESLPQKARDETKKALEDIAEPLKQEAYRFYQNAYESTRKGQVFTVWGTRAYDRMADMNPKKVAKIDELHVEPGYVSHVFEYDSSIATALH